jgi:E3 ubiquitin-protein ligase HUWE1
MAVEDRHAEDPDGDDWREALFSLLSTLPSSTARAGESMVAAGLIQILVEVLTLRTNKAERNHTKVMNLFDSLVYQVRDAFQTLANAKGLDILADLTAYEVESALLRAENGEGMPLSTVLKSLTTKFHTSSSRHFGGYSSLSTI